MAQDFLGNDILPGEVVVYLNHYKTSSELKVGIVEKVTEKKQLPSTVAEEMEAKSSPSMRFRKWGTI